VVRIESVGCGGFLTGSGFVAGENLVITNAHVIAGVSEPTVVDAEGRHAATTVLFDPSSDIAVLRTNSLAGDPLPLLSSILDRNDTAVTLGYPEGGPIEATPAGILGQTRAVGRDIYHDKLAIREVYQLQTRITTGNSGGPIVLQDGTVAGVIFAKSEARENTGYALTSVFVQPILDQAQGETDRVSTGACTR
jgi:S1-C subfamily serine protease